MHLTLLVSLGVIVSTMVPRCDDGWWHKPPEQGSDGDSDSDSDTDNDTDTDGDTDTDCDTDADSDTDADGDTEVHADTDDDVGGDADSDVDGDTDVDTDSDVDTDADIDGDTDADTDSDTDADGDCGSYSIICDNRCVDPYYDTQNCGGCGMTCREGEYCEEGQCICYDMMCGDRCVNPYDPDNCGACGNVCPEGARQCSMNDQGQIGCVPCNESEGFAECDGQCVYLWGNPDNCGACGNVCEDGAICAGMNCIVGNCPNGPASSDTEEWEGDVCWEGTICCDESCVNPEYDPRNCGGCGNQCRPGEYCENSACRCEGMMCGDQCVDPYDPDNCGACGNVCPTGARLCSSNEEGQIGCMPCDVYSEEGVMECDGRCISALGDSENCGTCGNVCEDGATCAAGHCVVGNCSIDIDNADAGDTDWNGECWEGSICCDDRCIEPNWDSQNCGGCGTACRAGESCEMGQCRCFGIICDDRCVDPYDPENCGACGNVCPTGSRQCSTNDEGQIACMPCTTYSPYYVECDNQCIWTGNDRNNCGACGNVCEPGGVCVSGACVYGEAWDSEFEDIERDSEVEDTGADTEFP